MRLLTLGRLGPQGSDFRRAKPLLLLTYLALEGARERRHLGELFWRGATNPLGSLSMALTQLRQEAPSVIEADRVRVKANIETDAGQLLTALERGESMAAVEGYGGPFLDGVYLPDWGAELEEWVYATREFLAGRVRQGLLKLADEEAALERYETAADWAGRAYHLAGAGEPDPRELERIHTLMVAGDRIGFDKLGEDAAAFGLTLPRSPIEAKKRLREVLRVRESTTRHNLPARGTSFVGRDLELREVARLLAEQRLVTLVGSGGVGKSRLAIQAGYQQLLQDQFTDGIFFVVMDALTSASSILPSIASALGFDLQGPGDPLQQIIHFLGPKRVLMVLDNFEHLLEGRGIASILLRGCPHLKLLVTSRERLHLEEEWLFEVRGLAYPDDPTPSLDEAGRFGAVQLFMLRARKADPKAVLDTATLPSVIETCKLVEGLPLALELAAAWVRVISIVELPQELRRDLGVLDTATYDVSDRHKTLRVSFEHSWKHLTPVEQQVLRKLSVFRGGFRRDAAGEVAGTTLPVLASLVDKSLLRLGSNGRFDRHPLLYQFMQEKLGEHSQEQAEVQAKHGAYHLGFLEKLNSRSSHKEAELLQAFEEERENIRAAWSWAVAATKVDELECAFWALRTYYRSEPRFKEAIREFDVVITGLDETDPTHHAILGAALTEKAWQTHLLGRNEEAIELAERSLKLLRPLGRTKAPLLPYALQTMVHCLFRLGAYAEAKRYAESNAAVTRTLDDADESVVIGLLDLGMVERALGNYHQAIQHQEAALALGRQYGHVLLEITVLLDLGITSLELGDLQEARSILEEGLQLVQEIGFQRLRTHFLLFLSRATLALGENRKAWGLGDEALKLVLESGATDMEPLVLTTLGRIATAESDFSGAETHLTQSLRVAWSVQKSPDVLEGLVALAELRARQGLVEQACELLGPAFHHQATEQGVKDEAQRILQSLHDQITPEALAEIQEGGNVRGLEDVMRELL